MNLVEQKWIARQMEAEARSLRDAAMKSQPPPRCYVCDVHGPGLFWAPSERGVCEMPMWLCQEHTGGWGVES